MSKNQITKRIQALENQNHPQTVLTTEKIAGAELWRWGSLIVKILRGVSTDDL